MIMNSASQAMARSNPSNDNHSILSAMCLSLPFIQPSMDFILSMNLLRLHLSAMALLFTCV